MEEIEPLELQQWLQDESRRKPLLLDVREPQEYEYCHIEGSLLMPVNDVPARIGELDPEADIVVICHHGHRSHRVGTYLEHSGFSRIYNLQGGVDAWGHDVDPAMPKY